MNIKRKVFKKMLQRVVFVVSLFLSLFPLLALAETSNLGLIDGIWFSQKNYVVEDEIILHTAIFNNSDHTVLGTVEFYDNEIFLGSRSFEVVDQHIKELTLATSATEGEHIFSAKITESKTTLDSGKIETLTPIVVASNSVKVVKRDTDRDGVPDDEDSDDDGDGYSDLQEEKADTDPLDANDLPTTSADTDTENSTTSNSNQDLIDSLIAILEKYQGPKEEIVNDISENQGEEGGDSIVEPTVAEPQIITTIAENHPGVATVTTGINSFQNHAVDFFEKNRTRNNQILEEDNSASEQDEGVLSRFEKVLRLVWGLLLNLFVMIFSCLWCVVLLTIALVYLLAKLILSRQRKE